MHKWCIMLFQWTVFILNSNLSRFPMSVFHINLSDCSFSYFFLFACSTLRFYHWFWLSASLSLSRTGGVCIDIHEHLPLKIDAHCLIVDSILHLFVIWLSYLYDCLGSLWLGLSIYKTYFIVLKTHLT
jgi:hypothetical protein